MSDLEDNSLDYILPENLKEDEMDVNIHFHCEHCFKLSKCKELPKIGWSCEIMNCVNNCGMRFHSCKQEEHELLCSHAKVACINAGNGCPCTLQRRYISEHLPTCPASIVVCNAEWNRWAVGSKVRDKITLAKGVIGNFYSEDLDMALAIDDQRLIKDMYLQPKRLRKMMCNSLTKRFPSLPLSIRGSLKLNLDLNNRKHSLTSSTTDDDEERIHLPPGLCLSVCTELLRCKLLTDGNKDLSAKTNKVVTFDGIIASECTHSHRKSSANAANNDDFAYLCCTHGIMKSICNFCRNDPEEPLCKYGKVWRETVDLSNPGTLEWRSEPRLEKVRSLNPFGMISYRPVIESDEEEDDDEVDDYEEDDDEEDDDEEDDDEEESVNGREELAKGPLPMNTPPPAPPTPKGVGVELMLKHYSRHQVKPSAMFTFHCMQEVRRDEFANHYQNLHAEIQESLDGWLLQRCPLHTLGCPFTRECLHPTKQKGEIVFCHKLRAFGIKPRLCHEDANKGCSLPEQNGSTDNDFFLASSIHISVLPYEVLQNIARHLDGFSLNNLSWTSHQMRDICRSLLPEKGLVLQEWIRTCVPSNGQNETKVKWTVGRHRWFFSKSFEQIGSWSFSDGPALSNHIAVCPYNKRVETEGKFNYVKLPNYILKMRNLKTHS